MEAGNINRTTASTGMNDVSSRSHAIFTINFTQVSRPHPLFPLNPLPPPHTHSNLPDLRCSSSRPSSMRRCPARRSVRSTWWTWPVASGPTPPEPRGSDSRRAGTSTSRWSRWGTSSPRWVGSDTPTPPPSDRRVMKLVQFVLTVFLCVHLCPSSRHVGRRRQHQPEEEVGLRPLQGLGADMAAEGQSGRKLQDHHDRQ